MFNKMTEHIFDWQVHAGMRKEGDRELYQYAYRMLISKIVSCLLIAGIAILTGTWKEVLAFLSAFMPLRQYAGGYHFQSAGICLFFSVLAMIIAGYGIAALTTTGGVRWFAFLWCISVVIIAFWAPVECKNKPLDAMEKKVYGARSRGVLCVESVICIVAVFVHWNILCAAIQMSHLVLACGLIAGKITIKKPFF